MNAYSSYLTPEQKKKKLLAQGYSDYLPKAATPQTVNPATSYADYLPAQQPAQNGYANIAKNMQQPAAPAVSGYAAMANNLAATPAPAQNGYGAIAQNMAAATPTSAPASTPTSYYDYARDSAKQSYDSGVAKSWSNLNKNLNPYGAIAESMASRGISQQSGYGAIAQSMASGQYANEQNMARQGYEQTLRDIQLEEQQAKELGVQNLSAKLSEFANEGTEPTAEQFNAFKTMYKLSDEDANTAYAAVYGKNYGAEATIGTVKTYEPEALQTKMKSAGILDAYGKITADKKPNALAVSAKGLKPNFSKPFEPTKIKPTNNKMNKDVDVNNLKNGDVIDGTDWAGWNIGKFVYYDGYWYKLS